MAKNFLQSFNEKAEQQPLLSLLVYSLLNFIRPAIYLFLTPFYLYYLSEPDYGLQDMLVTIGAFLMILCTFRLNASMLTVYYDYLDDKDKLRKYLRNIFSFSILIAVGFGSFFLLFGDIIFETLFKSEAIEFFPYGAIILGAVLISEINTTYFIYLRNEKDLVSYVKVISVQILMIIILQFGFVFFLEWGVFGLVLGNLLGNATVLLMILNRERDILTLNFDKSMINKSLKFSIPLIPYLLIYWVLSKGGKFILEQYADLTIVAVFALLVTLSNVVVILVDAVVNAVRPFLFEIFASKSKETQQEKVTLLTKMIVNVPLLIIPLIVLVGSNIWLVTSKETYHIIEEYITWVSLTTFILVYAKLFYQQLIFAKRSGVVTILSFLVMLVLVSFFYWLVPTQQIWGVIIATLVANILMATLFYFAAQHYQPVSYRLWNIFIIPMIFFLLLFGLEYWCLNMMELSRTTFSIIQFIVLLLVVILLNLNSVQEYKIAFQNRA